MSLRFLLLASCLLPVVCHAQSSLQQCRALTDKELRLQCYDQLADTQQAAVAPEAAAVTTYPVARELPAGSAQAAPVTTVSPERDEALFGTTGEKVESSFKELTVQVRSVNPDARKQLQFSMQNDQRWQQLDKAYIKVKAGDSCVISSGVFGSYLMKCEQSTKAIRVKRVD